MLVCVPSLTFQVASVELHLHSFKVALLRSLTHPCTPQKCFQVFPEQGKTQSSLCNEKHITPGAGQKSLKVPGLGQQPRLTPESQADPGVIRSA